MNNLRKDIEIAIKAHSAENGSDTPDFILAKYLTASLAAFDEAVIRRDRWYAKDKKAEVVEDGQSDIPESETRGKLGSTESKPIELDTKHHFVVTVNSDDDMSVSPISSTELMRARGFARRPTMTSLPKDAYAEPERANVAAFTEIGAPSYPAFVSINREKDGLYSVTVRTRGHDGNQMATIDKMSRNAIRSLAWDILKGDETLFQKLVQK